MSKEKHPLFISMEEAKTDEKFYADVESKLPLYIWKLATKYDESITVPLDVNDSTKGVVIAIIPK